MVDVIHHVLIGRSWQSGKLIQHSVPSGGLFRIQRIVDPVLLGPALGLQSGIRQSLGERIRKEYRIEIDLDHAAFVSKRAQHLIGHIPSMVCQSAAARMGGDDRSAGIFKDIVESLIRGVSDIDDHSEAVHFRDHFPAERAEPMPTLSLGCGISDLIVSIVRQGDVTNPKAMKNT